MNYLSKDTLVKSEGVVSCLNCKEGFYEFKEKVEYGKIDGCPKCGAHNLSVTKRYYYKLK